MLLGEVRTQHIQTREHPAAATRLLIVNRLFWRLNAEMCVDVALVLEVLRQVVDVVLRNGVEEPATHRLLCLLFLHLLEHLRCDAA